jgi:hypothetical protein
MQEKAWTDNPHDSLFLYIQETMALQIFSVDNAQKPELIRM